MQTSSNDAALDRWLGNVSRGNRRRRLVDGTLNGDRASLATVPLRFVLKIAEVGPARAITMAASVVGQRLRSR